MFRGSASLSTSIFQRTQKHSSTGLAAPAAPGVLAKLFPLSGGRETRLLRTIERHNRTAIEERAYPDGKAIRNKRVERLNAKITNKLSDDDIMDYQQMIEEMIDEHNLEPTLIAAALAKSPTVTARLNVKDPSPQNRKRRERPERRDRLDGRDRSERGDRRDRFDRDERRGRRERFDRDERRERGAERGNNHKNHVFDEADERFDRRDGPRRERGGGSQDHYRPAVGHHDGVKPGMIVGAIANEMGISGQDIGHIRIHDGHSTVALPTGMSPPEQKKLQGIWVAQRQLDAQKLDGVPEEPAYGGRGSGRKPHLQKQTTRWLRRWQKTWQPQQLQATRPLLKTTLSHYHGEQGGHSIQKKSCGFFYFHTHTKKPCLT